MPTSALFQRFVDDELGFSATLIGRVLAGTLQLLAPSRDSPLSLSERPHQADIVGSLQRGATAYERSFVESLGRQVAEALDASVEPSFGGAKSAAGGLELMDESRVEIDIEISRAMQLIDTTAEWELRELQTFTSTLLGQNHITAESNPFRPLVYATALWDAACTVTAGHVQRAVVLRTSAGVAAGLLKKAWAAASTRLESAGVEPGSYRTVILPSGTTFGRQTTEAPRAAGLSALLESMLPRAGINGLGAGADPKPLGVRNDTGSRSSSELEHALLRFDELLRNLPSDASLTGRAPPGSSRVEQHRSALLASAGRPVDRQIIELVTRLFESLLADTQLPLPLRPVLSRIQIPSLRVALAEHAVVESYEHPIWRLLDRIGEAGVSQSRLEDPRLASFLAFCVAVAEELAGASSPDTALFRRGLNRVDAFLAEQLQNQLRAAQPAVDAMQMAERREVLQQHLSQRLADQMVQVRTTPAIRRFITGVWAQVIADSMLRHGDQSDATMVDLKTADELLWSLKIPDHPQSRQRLITLLPGLLHRVRVGMDAVALPGAEQQAVLNELMTIHTEALRPGGRSGTNGTSGAMSPEEIVQRMRDEVLPDSPSARSFSDSVIDLSSMETVPAEHLPTGGDRVDDDPAKRVEAMRIGDRQRIFLQGRWSRVQLLWRSDRSLFFLFAGESASRTHSITRRALERLSSAGLVQPLEARSLVERSVDRMMRELSPRD
ncbi:MAG: DUF1631 family protein [Caldimonas sp.]